ncbi:MAG: bifunctional demethylmenaquinone methyltransferase/2-methoxy-6-polyprenyl-1,4-benzoquinol methylase UbiE [Bacteroidaceae bacterium]|nr:bifunctional demethylmenaquinone methyltransferase/2-methoxy-6-polyprenyl-1,4-benzoquinol methylase UbiE [Bacteroidaceae bacterium]
MAKYEQESIMPYDHEADKACQVERMFNNIAPHYDTLNHTLSLGIDRRWRRKAIDSLSAYKPKTLLDIATGTGDFALLAAKRLQPESIVGCDISDGMMEVAREKAKVANLACRITFQHEDCERLSFDDEAFDAVTVAYGVRNFAHMEQGLSEMLRVLRPGGHLVILELTAPLHFPMRQLFWIYSHVVMPVVGRIISGDRLAYTYLPASMHAFPQGERMQEILTRLGFSEVRFRRFTFGLCTMIIAEK